MKKSTQIILYIFLLTAGLLIFYLQLFVFEAPDGILGFLLCLCSVCLMVGSSVKLCQLSQKVKNAIFDILDFLFCIR